MDWETKVGNEAGIVVPQILIDKYYTVALRQILERKLKSRLISLMNDYQQQPIFHLKSLKPAPPPLSAFSTANTPQ